MSSVFIGRDKLQHEKRKSVSNSVLFTLFMVVQPPNELQAAVNGGEVGCLSIHGA